jgi:drug/metabolite transporter (DMT)-like permease
MIFGVLLALLASMSWALANVFIQKSGREVGPLRAMFFAVLASAVLSGIFSWLLDARAASVSNDALLWILASGVFGLGAYLCLFFAFEKAKLSLAVPLVSSWPLFSTIFSLAVLGEEAKSFHLFGAAVVFAGVLLVSLARSNVAEEKSEERLSRGRSLWIALGSAVFFGLMVPASAQVAPILGPFGASAAAFGVMLVLGTPLALIAQVSLRLPTEGRAIGLLLATGVCEIVGVVAMNLARSFAPLAVVAPVGGLSAALTLLYAWLFLGERPGLYATAGTLVAFAGVLLLSL